MKVKKILFTCIFVVSLFTTVFAVYKFGTANRSSASVKKNYRDVQSQSSLPEVVYDGKKMFVAKSTFYDYYSDSQVGDSTVPGKIADAIDYTKNTFGKFNTRLLEIMNYGDKTLCPAQYPLYQGRQSKDFSDFNNIYSKTDNSVNEASNYWLGANNNQIGPYATQGLVDSVLAYDSSKVSYVTQTNPDNKKTSYLPYFDKKFLTTNTHKDSKLALGSVRENVAFPFRTEEDKGVIYYEYDSAVDTIRFNNKSQLDYLGKNSNEMVKDRLGNGGVFPDNVAADSNSNQLNFGFGVKIEVPFNMTSDGKIKGQDMIFEFTGDDDVWVFIDGILALDMGGAHHKISGSINFATKKSLVSGVKNNQVAFASRTLGNYGTGDVSISELGLVKVPGSYLNKETDFSDELKKSLTDTTKEHTLTLFYLERGMDVSNMKMKFNLPEPTKLFVSNKIDTEDVGETYREETKNVAKKDNFLYDVADNTKGKQAEIDLYGEEDVTFLNEFDMNDILIVQEKALKGTERKITDLYTTSWILSDAEAEISHDTSLVTNDIRTKERTVLFKNTKNEDTPKLRVDYTNKPLVNKFMIVCEVSDKYKDFDKNYKDKEIKYEFTYSKVFGGSSKETKYKGKYIVYKEDDTTEEKNTDDGIIKLKPGEKAVFDKIPVMTNLKVVAKLDEKEILTSVKTTTQFNYEKDTKSVSGALTNNSNVVQFIVGTDVEKVNDKSNLTNEEIVTITGEETPKLSNPEKLEKTLRDGEYDKVPTTGDETNFITWLTIFGISLLFVFMSGIILIKTKM